MQAIATRGCCVNSVVGLEGPYDQVLLDWLYKGRANQQQTKPNRCFPVNFKNEIPDFIQKYSLTVALVGTCHPSPFWFAHVLYRVQEKLAP